MEADAVPDNHDEREVVWRVGLLKGNYVVADLGIFILVEANKIEGVVEYE